MFFNGFYKLHVIAGIETRYYSTINGHSLQIQQITKTLNHVNCFDFPAIIL